MILCFWLTIKVLLFHFVCSSLLFSLLSGVMLVHIFFQGELGANAILAVSIAACKAGAAEKEA